MCKSLLYVMNFMYIFYSKSLLTNCSLCYTERVYMSINGEIEAFEGSLSCFFLFLCSKAIVYGVGTTMKQRKQRLIRALLQGIPKGLFPFR